MNVQQGNYCQSQPAWQALEKGRERGKLVARETRRATTPVARDTVNVVEGLKGLKSNNEQTSH